MKKVLLGIILLFYGSITARAQDRFVIFGAGYASFENSGGTNYFFQYRRTFNRDFSWKIGFKVAMGRGMDDMPVTNGQHTTIAPYYYTENHIQLNFNGLYNLLHSKEDLFALQIGSGFTLARVFTNSPWRSDGPGGKVMYGIGVQFIVAPVIRLSSHWYVGADANAQYFFEGMALLDTLDVFIQYKL